MTTIRVLGVAVASSLVMSAGVAAADATSRSPGVPPASDFSARVDNPWFPLKPGSRYVYVGVKDGTPSRDVVTVSHRTKIVAGADCVVVEDRLYLRGHLGERTTDWYSQDSHGNVWYFGEDTAELDAHGRVTSTSGTWRAGVRGAQPGIFMPAHPRVGRAYRQEYSKGQAEDHFKVIGLFGGIGGSGVTAENALLTQEWTPLEPGTIDHKLYVRGVGTVLEQTEKGGNERAELVALTRGA